MSKVRVKRLSSWAALGAAVNVFGDLEDMVVSKKSTAPRLEIVPARSRAEAMASPWRQVGKLLSESAQEVQTRLSGAHVRKKI